MLVWKSIAIIHAFLSILFFVSRREFYRKEIWISHYDEEDLKLVPECANLGYSQIRYTLMGAIFKSVGFGGIISAILIFTDAIWMPIISMATLGVIWRLGFCGWDLVVICSVTASIICFCKHKSKIIVG